LGCRRQTLLAYFGEAHDPCGNCDLCANPPETFDATQAVQKALSAALRTGEYFGAGHLIDVLTGNETEKVRARGHDGLPTFGVGREMTRRAWQGVFRQMMGHDLLRPDPERHGALRVTEAAHPILRGEQSVTLRRETAAPKTRRPAAKALVSEEDAPLLSALKAKRRALAEAAKMPAYIVFNDRTLVEMAECRPQSLDEMARITGVGAKKLDQYGAAFLEVITGAGEAPHPARRKLAGQEAGTLYDRLVEKQTALARGETGLEKPLSCSAAQLARIAKTRPRDLSEMERLLDKKRSERFGPAFLDVLHMAD
jgi:ATP-dependent DNA helicase RecQ